jgi:hypothetical protein
MRADDRICSLVLLGVAVAACWGAAQHEVGTLSSPGPGLFPLILGAVLGVLSLIILVRDLQARQAATPAAVPGGVAVFAKEIIYVLLALVAYGLLLIPLGFIVTTFMVFGFLLRFVTKQNWYLAVGGAAALAVGAYVIFDIFLRVPLPQGVLGV